MRIFYYIWVIQKYVGFFHVTLMKLPFFSLYVCDRSGIFSYHGNENEIISIYHGKEHFSNFSNQKWDIILHCDSKNEIFLKYCNGMEMRFSYHGNEDCIAFKSWKQNDLYDKSQFFSLYHHVDDVNENNTFTSLYNSNSFFPHNYNKNAIFSSIVDHKTEIFIYIWVIKKNCVYFCLQYPS